MDKPANQQSNPPLLDGSETMQKVRPVVRILAMLIAVANFGAAASIGFRHGLWPATWSAFAQGLWPAAWCAFSGFVFAAVGVTGYPPFRHMRMKA
ncbi:MAG TPA: hypothetical protein VGY55_13165 [Pirellulales bacterium]|jgi:hypothetical protein|nr:hypothetical protein [Pirellulales bacterium]